MLAKEAKGDGAAGQSVNELALLSAPPAREMTGTEEKRPPTDSHNNDPFAENQDERRKMKSRKVAWENIMF